MNNRQNLLVLFAKLEVIISVGLVLGYKDSMNLVSTKVSDSSSSQLLHRIRRESLIKEKPLNSDFKSKLADLEHTPEEWIEEAVDMHNRLRKLHGIKKNLVLDYKLAYKSQVWAMELGRLSLQAGKIILHHDPKLVGGENIGARRLGTKNQLQSLPGSFPVRIWYSEIGVHDWNKNDHDWRSGHFSQVVWNATERIGCAKYISDAECKGSTITKMPILIMVCQYYPGGNWITSTTRWKSAFNSHVLPPIEGRPNTIPDFKQHCPPSATPCANPHVCCTKSSSPQPAEPMCTS